MAARLRRDGIGPCVSAYRRGMSTYGERSLDVVVRNALGRFDISGRAIHDQ